MATVAASTTASATGAAVGGRPSLVLRALRRRPTIGWEVAIAVAWIALVAVHAAGSSAPHHVDHGAGLPLGGVPLGGVTVWLAMSMAMMLPAALPAVRHVAVKSFRWRRRRAMAELVTVYLGIWLVYGVVVLSMLAWWAPGRGRVLLAVVLAVAAGWQLTTIKRQALVDCHRSSPLPPRGWPATVGVARFGLRYGRACLGSCWAIMLVMAVATTGELLWMVVLTGIVSAEKLVKKPRQATRYGAAVLGAAAVAVGLVAATG